MILLFWGGTVVPPTPPVSTLPERFKIATPIHPTIKELEAMERAARRAQEAATSPVEAPEAPKRVKRRTGTPSEPAAPWEAPAWEPTPAVEPADSEVAATIEGLLGVPVVIREDVVDDDDEDAIMLLLSAL